MKLRDRKISICRPEELAEKQFKIIPIVYRDEPHSGIVFRFNHKVYAYLNQCVHMPRELNCERNTIFDSQQQLLRCSMHGIVYDPKTGKSLSTMCNGERLQAIRLCQTEEMIYFDDKRLRSPTGSSLELSCNR